MRPPAGRTGRCRRRPRRAAARAPSVALDHVLRRRPRLSCAAGHSPNVIASIRRTSVRAPSRCRAGRRVRVRLRPAPQAVGQLPAPFGLDGLRHSLLAQVRHDRTAASPRRARFRRQADEDPQRARLARPRRSSGRAGSSARRCRRRQRRSGSRSPTPACCRACAPRRGRAASPPSRSSTYGAGREAEPLLERRLQRVGRILRPDPVAVIAWFAYTRPSYETSATRSVGSTVRACVIGRRTLPGI